MEINKVHFPEARTQGAYPTRKTCKLCQYYDPGISHFMWQCEKLSSSRGTLIDTIKRTLPHSVYVDLSLRDPESLTDYILEEGEPSLPAQDWKRLVQATAEFIMNICSHAAESVECDVEALCWGSPAKPLQRVNRVVLIRA